MISKDVLTYLFFVLLATLVWYIYAMNTIRKVWVTVPIEYTGLETEVVLSDSIVHELQIEIQDKGLQLRNYMRKPFTLHIPLGAQVSESEGTIAIPAENLRGDLRTLLQGTTSLQSIRPEAIQGAYYRLEHKQVPLVMKGSYSAAQQYYIAAEPVLSSTSVVIYGQRKQLDSIDCIYTEERAWTELRDTVRCAVGLVLPEGIRSEEQEVTVTFVAEMFTEKRFTRPIEVREVPEGLHLHLFPQEVEVTVSVGMSRFGSIKPEDVSVYCLFPALETEKIVLETACRNEAVIGILVYPRVVDFLVEKEEKNEEDTDGGSADAVSTD